MTDATAAPAPADPHDRQARYEEDMREFLVGCAYEAADDDLARDFEQAVQLFLDTPLYVAVPALHNLMGMAQVARIDREETEADPELLLGVPQPYAPCAGLTELLDCVRQEWQQCPADDRPALVAWVNMMCSKLLPRTRAESTLREHLPALLSELPGSAQRDGGGTAKLAAVKQRRAAAPIEAPTVDADALMAWFEEMLGTLLDTGFAFTMRDAAHMTPAGMRDLLLGEIDSLTADDVPAFAALAALDYRCTRYCAIGDEASYPSAGPDTAAARLAAVFESEVRVWQRLREKITRPAAEGTTDAAPAALDAEEAWNAFFSRLDSELYAPGFANRSFADYIELLAVTLPGFGMRVYECASNADADASEDLSAALQHTRDLIAEGHNKIAAQSTSGESGGGLVRITINAKYQPTEVRLAPEVLREDVGVVEDLIAGAMLVAVDRLSALRVEVLTEVQEQAVAMGEELGVFDGTPFAPGDWAQPDGRGPS